MTDREINELLNTLQSNREQEEEKLSKMNEQEVANYMRSKAQAGIEFAKRLGLKVGE